MFLFPSELCRLILGYLEEESFLNTYNSFLAECKYLEECRHALSKGIPFNKKIHGKTLKDYFGYNTDYSSNETQTEPVNESFNKTRPIQADKYKQIDNINDEAAKQLILTQIAPTTSSTRIEDKNFDSDNSCSSNTLSQSKKSSSKRKKTLGMKRKSSILLTPPKNQNTQAATSDVNLILDQNEFDGIESFIKSLCENGFPDKLAQSINELNMKKLTNSSFQTSMEDISLACTANIQQNESVISNSQQNININSTNKVVIESQPTELPHTNNGSANFDQNQLNQIQQQLEMHQEQQLSENYNSSNLQEAMNQENCTDNNEMNISQAGLLSSDDMFETNCKFMIANEDITLLAEDFTKPAFESLFEALNPNPNDFLDNDILAEIDFEMDNYSNDTPFQNKPNEVVSTNDIAEEKLDNVEEKPNELDKLPEVNQEQIKENEISQTENKQSASLMTTNEEKSLIVEEAPPKDDEISDKGETHCTILLEDSMEATKSQDDLDNTQTSDTHEKNDPASKSDCIVVLRKAEVGQPSYSVNTKTKSMIIIAKSNDDMDKLKKQVQEEVNLTIDMKNGLNNIKQINTSQPEANKTNETVIEQDKPINETKTNEIKDDAQKEVENDISESKCVFRLDTSPVCSPEKNSASNNNNNDVDMKQNDTIQENELDSLSDDVPKEAENKAEKDPPANESIETNEKIQEKKVEDVEMQPLSSPPTCVSKNSNKLGLQFDTPLKCLASAASMVMIEEMKNDSNNESLLYNISEAENKSETETISQAPTSEAVLLDQILTKEFNSTPESKSKRASSSPKVSKTIREIFECKSKLDESDCSIIKEVKPLIESNNKLERKVDDEEIPSMITSTPTITNYKFETTKLEYKSPTKRARATNSNYKKSKDYFNDFYENIKEEDEEDINLNAENNANTNQLRHSSKSYYNYNNSLNDRLKQDQYYNRNTNKFKPSSQNTTKLISTTSTSTSTNSKLSEKNHSDYKTTNINANFNNNSGYISYNNNNTKSKNKKDQLDRNRRNNEEDDGNKNEEDDEDIPQIIKYAKMVQSKCKLAKSQQENKHKN